MGSADRQLENHVRHIVRESQNIVRRSKDGKELKEALQKMKLVMQGTLPETGDGFTCSAIKEEFVNAHYQKWLNFLIANINEEWLNMSDNPLHMFDAFFLEGGITHEAFLTLYHAISTSGRGFKLNKIVTIMEEFIMGNHLQTLMKTWCETKFAENHIHHREQLEELISAIVSLPEKVSSKLKRETSEMFYPKIYMRRVAEDTVACLRHIHIRSAANKLVDFTFLGHLMGKLCMTGHGGLIWPVLLGELSCLINTDILWCELCERLVQEIPERALESVIVPLVQHAEWYGTVARILGENVTQHKIKFLLTNKLILLRHFKEDRTLQNIIGCLASSPSRSYLVAQVLQTVLEVWSDGSAVRHTSYDQHLYITKAVLICLSMLSPKDKQKLKTKLLTGMMPGIQVHLDSPLPKMQRLGMIVAESISQVLDPDGPKLHFEYEKDEECEKLVSLLLPVTPPDTKVIQSNDRVPPCPGKKDKAVQDDFHANTKSKSANEPDSDSSSDDDLQPYDMSNDVKVSKLKRPLYLRDCMTGLLNPEEPEKMEISLQVAESLIRSHASSVMEVSTEFAKILLHLQDTEVVTDFMSLRHKALVALLVTSPKEVATYITEEFYGPNYNIRQRLDILESLVDAAQELSSVQPTSVGRQQTQDEVEVKQENIGPTEDQNWRQIVEERIARKTRRFAHGHKLPPPAALNRLAPVAGHFFFPLLAKFDQPERTLDLLGDDHMVLQRLLFSLGVIIHASTNAPIASQMGDALLKFVWMLRYHPQPAVRRGVLFSICMLLLSVPGHVLITDMSEDLAEVRLWLQDVTESDTDQENQKLSIQGLVLMQETVRKELER